MITLMVERNYGSATVRARVTAPSMERALRLCGEDTRVVETGRYFAPRDVSEPVVLHSALVAGNGTRVAV